MGTCVVCGRIRPDATIRRYAEGSMCGVCHAQHRQEVDKLSSLCEMPSMDIRFVKNGWIPAPGRPLYPKTFAEATQLWHTRRTQWCSSNVRVCSSVSEYAGPRPLAQDYMPDFDYTDAYMLFADGLPVVGPMTNVQAFVRACHTKAIVPDDRVSSLVGWNAEVLRAIKKHESREIDVRRVTTPKVMVFS